MIRSIGAEACEGVIGTFCFRHYHLTVWRVNFVFKHKMLHKRLSSGAVRFSFLGFNIVGKTVFRKREPKMISLVPDELFLYVVLLCGK